MRVCHCVPVAAAVLSIILPVAPIPRRRVHGAVNPLHDIILAQQVRIHECADFGRAPIRRWVAAVIGRLGLACRSALCVVAVGVEFVAHVGVSAIEQRGIDCATYWVRRGESGI